MSVRLCLLLLVISALGVRVMAQPTCPPDLAEPFGTLDAADPLEFLALFDASDPSADWDASGSIDFFDVLAYLTDYDAAVASIPPTIESTFDATDEQWLIADISVPVQGVPSVVASYTPTYEPAGGNPDGAISSIDPSGVAFFFSAPLAFRGDKSAYFGGAFTWDQQQNEFQSVVFEALVFTDGQVGLYYLDNGPNVGSFRTYDVPLVGSSFRVGSNNGPIASDALLGQVLSNLTGVYILGDWVSEDVSAIDNVRLQAPDCPVARDYLNTDGG